MSCRTLSRLCRSLALGCEMDRVESWQLQKRVTRPGDAHDQASPQPLRTKLLEDLNASPDIDDPVRY